MKHPFWIINSTLLLLFIFVLGFVYFSRVSLPSRENIEPESYFKPSEKMVQVNIKKIYENDLFGTYSKEFPTPEQPDFSVPFPEPPRDSIIPIPAAPKPQFLEPLPISLKGIIIIRSDYTKNRTILEDNKTNQEATYKVGDTIEDAQLIRIFSNKIIFLRSNGQQEVLYLREQDAKDDPMYASIEGWQEVIRPIDATRFIVNKDEFIKRVPNLAQFIDMLRLTTAYQKGESIGTRIGQLDKNGLGIYLGLQTGDIITSINDIPTGSSQKRLAAYKKVLDMKQGDTIVVVLTRNGQELELQFTLKKFNKTKKKQQASIERLTQKEKRQALEEKHRFAPTLKQIREREKNLMLQKGQSPF